MKSSYYYSLSIIFVLVFLLCSFERGRHTYRNLWTIPAQKNLKIKNSRKENLEVVLYNTSKTESLKYINNKNEVKDLPKNDSVITKINFANELYIVNNSNEEVFFKIKILKNTGKIKAQIIDEIKK